METEKTTETADDNDTDETHGTGDTGDTGDTGAVAPPERGGRRGMRRRPWPRAARPLLFLLLAALGALAAATAFGGRSYRWRAFTVAAGVRPAAAGQTVLEVPPLGAVRAHTHRAPVALYARLDAVSFEDLRRLALSSTPRAELERDLRGFARQSAADFAARLVGWGAAGALLAPVLLRSRRAREWLAAPPAGALAVAALLLLTRATFRPEAFQSPTYTGSLQQAPWAIALARNAVSNTEALGARLRNVAVNLQALYGRIGAAAADPAGDAGTVRVLHVSDIHNNPAAVSFVRELALRFAVSAVIDTGDLSDFGTPVEANAVRGLAGLRGAGGLAVPYLFVAGNHDSEATVRAVAAGLGGTVLRAGAAPVTVAGLRVVGAPDPSARREGAGGVDTSPDALREAGEELKARYHGADPRPDVVCVHNPRQAEPLLGVAPLVLCGHMHRPSVAVERGTVVCNAGTTGAAGGRYFERAEGVPFSAAVLHFRPPGPDGAGPPRLLFIDQVSLDGSLRQYSITRRAFGAGSPPGAGAAPEAAEARRAAATRDIRAPGG